MDDTAISNITNNEWGIASNMISSSAKSASNGITTIYLFEESQ